MADDDWYAGYDSADLNETVTDDDDHYAGYVPTATNRDFTRATIVVVAVVLAALVPLATCERKRRKRRDARRADDGNDGGAKEKNRSRTGLPGRLIATARLVITTGLSRIAGRVDNGDGGAKDEDDRNGTALYTAEESSTDDAYASMDKRKQAPYTEGEEGMGIEYSIDDAYASTEKRKQETETDDESGSSDESGIGDAYASMDERERDHEDLLEYMERKIFPEEDDDDTVLAFAVEDFDGEVREQTVVRPRWYHRFLRPKRFREAQRKFQEQQAAELAAVLMGSPGDAEGDEELTTTSILNFEGGVEVQDEISDNYVAPELPNIAESTSSVSILTEVSEKASEGGAEAAAEREDAPKEERPWREEEEGSFAKCWRTARVLFSWDAEASRIARIALPATVGSATSTLNSAATSALVSYYSGADNYVAYSMVYVLVELASTLVGGIGSAASVLVAQAIGAERRFLAGQYEQAAMIIEWVFVLPLYGAVWRYFVDIVEWMGLEREIGELGMQYLPWLLMSYPISDCSEVISELMWAEERGGTMTIIDNTYYVTYIGMLLGLIFGVGLIGDLNLMQLGILDLFASVFYFAMILSVVEWKGWLEPYKKGLLRSFSIKNWKLVKSILTMSLPLTVGGIVSTCEWELLTIFATRMGSAEVAAWTILGSIWGVFEYFPGGFTTAAELRVSRHLGKGKPGKAKVAAYKCMLFSVATTAVITALFCFFRDTVIGAYTNVEVIREILSDLVLLVGIANIVMVIGVMAYTILCAQNRTNLATGTYAFLSFAVTLPLSTYFVFYRGYDLQSVVFSLIAGYSLSSLVLMVYLLTTNWVRCSERVVRKADKAQKEQERLSEQKEHTRLASLEAEKNIEKRLELAEMT